MSTAASPIVVSPPASPAPVATPSPATPAPTAAEVAQLKADLQAEKEKGAEHERTAQFWYGKANTKAAPEKTAAPAEEDEDVLDLITSKGAKGLDALLQKRGFIRAVDVDAKVNEKAAQITSEAKLIDDYPELGKKDSEFFKATALHYGELKKEGVPERAAMRMAAERAELQGIRAGTIKTPTQKTEEEKATRAADRAARAAAGAGDHGGRAAAENSDDEELTPEQRTAAIKMLAGDGVTEEQAIEKYKARAKKGIVMRAK